MFQQCEYFCNDIVSTELLGGSCTETKLEQNVLNTTEEAD